MLTVTKFANRQPRIGGSQFGRSAVLVRPTNEEHFIAELPAKPRMDISRQQRAHKIAEMLDAVHIGNSAGDEKLGHRLRPSSSLGRRTRNAKALPLRTEGLRARLQT